MTVYDKSGAGLSVSAPVSQKGVVSRAVVELGEGPSDELLPIFGAQINLNGPISLQWPQQEPSHKTDTTPHTRTGKWYGVDWYNETNINGTTDDWIECPNHNFETGDNILLITPESTHTSGSFMRSKTYHVDVPAEAVSICFWTVYSEFDPTTHETDYPNGRDIIYWKCESADDDPVDNIAVQPPGDFAAAQHAEFAPTSDGRTVTLKWAYPRDTNGVTTMPSGSYNWNLLWSKVSNPDGGLGMWIVVNKAFSFPRTQTTLNGADATTSHTIGHKRTRDFYAIRGQEDANGRTNKLQLAATKADAIAGNAIALSNGWNSGLPVHIIDIKEFAKSKNSCFDHQNNKYPAFGQWNGHPTTQEYYNVNTPNSASLNEPQLWWRHYSPILLSWDGFKGFTGCDWLSTSVGHRLVNPTIFQRKIVKLYGSGSTDPAGFDSRPQAGIRFMNHDRAGNPAELRNHGPVFSHITSDNNAHTLNYDSTMLHGFDGGWARNEFSTILLTTCPQSTWDNSDVVEPGESGKGNRYDRFPFEIQSEVSTRTLPLHYVRPGGKIKFQAKVRIPEDDTFRPKNFGGMYVTLMYPSTTYGHHTCAIYYVMFKNAGDTINLPTGRLTGEAGKNNWQGLAPYSQVTYPHKMLRPNDKTVTEVAVYNAEDYRSFKLVTNEIDIPADFDTSSEAHCKIGFSVYYSENGGNMSGTLSAAQGGNDEAPVVDGVNDQCVYISQIQEGKTYQVKDYGDFDANVMVQIAGTELGPTMPSNKIIPGGTYTFTNTGGAQEDWSSIYIDDLGGGEFAASLLTAQEIEGMQVKIGPGTNVGALNGNATVQEGGHPINSFIKVENTSGLSVTLTDTGGFKPTTGAIEIFSPLCEYYNTI